VTFTTINDESRDCMSDRESEVWQCGDCGTLIDDPETRKCRNCGGINFYPLADDVPGDDSGTIETEPDLDLDRALERLSRRESGDVGDERT
jgi:predicted  nucleic acid-binding Zn-ribbon protein